MTRIEKILNKQVALQKLVKMPIDTNLEAVRDELGEKYIFKMIEEAIELRKEFPSTANPWSKTNHQADFKRIKEEACDVMFFLINFLLTFKISPDELLNELEKVQDNNFNKIKGKMMDQLNQDILKVQNHVSGVGQGNLSPRYIFIGQNPGKDITQGYRFFSNKEDGSSQILLPILENLGIIDQCYFTNVVKSTTEGNAQPSDDLASFWTEFLDKEIEILKANNPNAIIITMGKWTFDQVIQRKYPGSVVAIKHPSYIMRKNMNSEDYANEIKAATSHSN